MFIILLTDMFCRITWNTIIGLMKGRWASTYGFWELSQVPGILSSQNLDQVIHFRDRKNCIDCGISWGIGQHLTFSKIDLCGSD